MNNQAFAWNPSIRGGKAEDTVILHDGNIEWLTATPDLPIINAVGEREGLSGGGSAGEVMREVGATGEPVVRLPVARS